MRYQDPQYRSGGDFAKEAFDLCLYNKLVAPREHGKLR